MQSTSAAAHTEATHRNTKSITVSQTAWSAHMHLQAMVATMAIGPKSPGDCTTSESDSTSGDHNVFDGFIKHFMHSSEESGAETESTVDAESAASSDSDSETEFCMVDGNNDHLQAKASTGGVDLNQWFAVTQRSNSIRPQSSSNISSCSRDVCDEAVTRPLTQGNWSRFLDSVNCCLISIVLSGVLWCQLRTWALSVLLLLVGYTIIDWFGKVEGVDEVVAVVAVRDPDRHVDVDAWQNVGTRLSTLYQNCAQHGVSEADFDE